MAIMAFDINQYRGRWHNDNIAVILEQAPQRIAQFYLSSQMYGYTFDPAYQQVPLPWFFSMDFWREHGDSHAALAPCTLSVSNDNHTCSSIQELLIMRAIDETGDGRTPESPLWVLDVRQAHEYIVRHILYSGRRVVMQGDIDGTYCIELQDDDNQSTRLYFKVINM